MAVPTFVSAGAVTAGGPFTTVTVTPSNPTGLVDGDLVVCVAHWWNRNGQTGTVIEQTWPGWTQQDYEVLNPAGSLADFAIAVFTASYSVSLGVPVLRFTGGNAATSTYMAQTFGVRGADLVDPIDVMGAVVQTPTAQTTITVPGITTTGPDRMIIVSFGKGAQASGGGLSPGATQIGSLNTAAGNDAYWWLLRTTAVSAGTILDWNATISGSPTSVLVGKTFAINPVSATPDQTFTPDYIPSGTAFYVPIFTNADDTVVSFPFLAATTTFYAPRFDVQFSPAFWTEGTDFFDATFTATSGETGQPDQPVTLQRFSAEVFPPGTVVSIHEQHTAGIDRAPVGLALSQVTVGVLGDFDVTGLSDRKFYVAYAFVGGKHRYLRFRYELSPA